MKNFFLLFFFLFTNAFVTYAQNKADDFQKTGWSPGVLPNISYNSDIGFKAGAVCRLFDYGDGNQYPDYKHSFYLDIYASTKKSENITLEYDSKYLFKKTRITAAVKYYTERLKNFYGFNGYKTFYNSKLIKINNPEYITRAYYWHQQKNKQMLLTIRRNFNRDNWFFNTGFYLCFVDIQSVDIDMINKGKSGDDILPPIKDAPGLYEQYIDWGLIKPEEKNGGNIIELSAGLIYDSRVNEANPVKGCYSLVQLRTGRVLQYPKSYLTIRGEHRQYFTIIQNILTFAYRVGIEQKIVGTVPFYLLPALGGGGSIRGIQSNRLLGNGVTFLNAEFRWKIINRVFRDNNFYIAIIAFQDAGMVMQNYDAETNSPQALQFLQQGTNEKPHLSGGVGIYLAMNENFIISFDYGRAYNLQDGTAGLYIGLNYMF